MTGVNGTEITTIIDYNEEMKKYLPGSKVKLTVMRDNREATLEVVYGEKS